LFGEHVRSAGEAGVARCTTTAIVPEVATE
jgi:hypothetical protein